MKNSIVWLASFPKSGNTWTRIFLANYFANRDAPLSINEADRFGFGDSVLSMYQRVAGPGLDVNNKPQVVSVRNHVLQAIVANNADLNFVKTHNAFTNAYGVDLFPRQVSRCGIYIVRNPQDVVLSYARHFGISHEDVVMRMSRSDHLTLPYENQVTQFLGSWSDHVSGWASTGVFPVLTVRYEDMLNRPVDSFRAILQHIGAPVDEARLEKAVRFSSFDEVSKQEREQGFKEASHYADRFFAKGEAGQWREGLAPELSRKIRKQHRKVMKKHGYLE
uniref:sulfotransferase domain-containing protein n=1 Tax=Roseovarius indicus TaxID=540747 RepID=UPI003B52E1EC